MVASMRFYQKIIPALALSFAPAANAQAEITPFTHDELEAEAEGAFIRCKSHFGGSSYLYTNTSKAAADVVKPKSHVPYAVLSMSPVSPSEIAGKERVELVDTWAFVGTRENFSKFSILKPRYFHPVWAQPKDLKALPNTQENLEFLKDAGLHCRPALDGK